MNSILSPQAIESKLRELLGQSSLPLQRNRIYTVVSYCPAKVVSEYQSYFNFLSGKRPLRLICIETASPNQQLIEVSASCKLRYGIEEVCLEKIILRTPKNEDMMFDLWFPLVDHNLPAILVWADSLAKLANSCFKDEAVFDKIIINSEQSSFNLKAALQDQKILDQVFRGLTALGDLLWTKLSPLRIYIARLFEQCGDLSLLSRIAYCSVQGLSVNHFLLTAFWLATRLNYKLKEVTEDGLIFIRPDKQSCLMSSQAALDTKIEIVFKIDNGHTLSLEVKDNQKLDYLFNGRILMTQPFISLSTPECLLIELDSISSDPIYDEALRQTRNFHC